MYLNEYNIFFMFSNQLRDFIIIWKPSEYALKTSNKFSISTRP